MLVEILEDQVNNYGDMDGSGSRFYTEIKHEKFNELRQLNEAYRVVNGK